ncbi:RtcB family protein [Persicimonas caeni]|uniref:3'-phosphate/5'-hydroxy nucleic acid ligase n=1 Tax=Persicimonas caeni TaxID=2292766 RepID=A0A4Y6PS49_PERCE|nr:RtcB family protein [Persicimonas caeni]QDG51060.1 RtcB family protein [Persicimonas caeni]QED32281.1 RtcB family protein [Persicimonas caeni]
MRGSELKQMGYPEGNTTTLALNLVGKACESGWDVDDVRDVLEKLVEEPGEYAEHEIFGELAEAIGERVLFRERDEPAPWKQWGSDLDPAAIGQLENACRLPVSVAGALMPDAHRGYGLPIGGVLATEGAVIPYAVGVDIACRMKMTVFDAPPSALEHDKEHLSKIIEDETRFGIGAYFDKPHDHEVMDRDWGVSPVTRRLKEKARYQLGSSGSGNHFAEWGVLTLADDALGVKKGQYLALLTHSGSRGVGASVANHYSKLAREWHPELPKELQHLAWLELDSELGQEYWAAMSLMGEYAAANHAVMHREIVEALGAEVVADVENHHNFAWKEEHDGREVVVHRKGATPAGKGVLGVIPGSMAEPGFVVRGKGEATSLESAAHGAGRVMSRRQAKREISWKDVQAELDASGVTLLSADLDEAPDVYKDIESVMSHQDDLVEIVARFDPKIVKMAPPGEPPED